MSRARRLCKWSGRDLEGTTVRTHLAEPGEALCATHRAAEDRQRGTRSARGYGAAHVAARAAWAPTVATGKVRCWRCNGRIIPGTVWVMGHQDDRRLAALPEHQRCNQRAAGLARHGLPWTPERID